MKNDNIEFKLKYDRDLGTLTEIFDIIRYDFKVVAEKMKKMYDSPVIVVIKNCDSAGNYDTMDIHVFANLLEANELINGELHEFGHEINIYQYSCNSDRISCVMNKYINSNILSRSTGYITSMFDDSEGILSIRMQKVFDMKETNVTLHSVCNI